MADHNVELNPMNGGVSISKVPSGYNGNTNHGNPPDDNDDHDEGMEGVDMRMRSSSASYPPDIKSAVDEVHKHRDKRNDAHILRRLHLLQSIVNNEKEIAGWKKFMKKIEDEAADQKMIADISSFKYGTDRSFLRESTPAQVWGAIKRRAAWARNPIRMMFLTVTQVVLCVIVIVSATDDINRGTIIMAILFIMALSASNPMTLCGNVTDWGKDYIQKYGVVPVVLISIFGFPVIALIYLVAGTLDLMVGKMIDVSFGGMCNIIVRVIVVFTAISVGLRSGNPINAIQTFAGFDFIDSMDELVIDSLDLDYEALSDAKNIVKHNDTKMLLVRLGVYITTPIIMGCFLYITAVNDCYAFCGTDDGIDDST